MTQVTDGLVKSCYTCFFEVMMVVPGDEKETLWCRIFRASQRAVPDNGDE